MFLSNKIKLTVLTFFILFAIHVKASDYAITDGALNFRSGPGMQHTSLMILKKGDTLELLENEDYFWAKVMYHEKIGFVSKKHLIPIAINEETNTTIPPEKRINKESDSSGFIILAIIFSILLVIGFSIKKTGQKKRSKSTAVLLAFFLGAFGFHKFYLGKTVQGIIYVLLFWSFIPAIIGVIECIIIGVMNESDFNNRYNTETLKEKIREARTPTPVPMVNTSIQANHTNHTIINDYRPKVKVSIETNNTTGSSKPTLKSTMNTSNIAVDDSIIDVSSETYKLNLDSVTNQEHIKISPPYWSHMYVYSYDNIKSANNEQLQFYQYLKEKVLNNEFIDIQGNTNYAFILYFDFFKEYAVHQDIQKLDKQLQLIADICPKTKNYSFKLLQHELQKRNDLYSFNRLKELDNILNYSYSEYNPELHKLGTQYKEKLNLSKQEISWLNKFYNPSNVFLSIEGCCLATAKQYVLILKKLDAHFKKNNTTLSKAIENIKLKLKDYYSKEYSTWGYYDTSYLDKQGISEIYLTIFKRVENSVRQEYGHKRKISGDFPNVSIHIIDEFEITIGNQVNQLIYSLREHIEKPNIDTQIALNAQNVNRWKDHFNKVKEEFKKESLDIFKGEIAYLEKTNQLNPNIENIFFEASKFIAKYDKTLALKYYAYYIYYDLKSSKFDNKELTKTVQKSLFSTEEQVSDFIGICNDLIKTSDLESALQSIEKIYLPKRKKINLDFSVIQEVEIKHEGTVELLNEYLHDPESITEDTIDENEQIEIIKTEVKETLFISGISMNEIQENLIKRIIENDFVISQSEVDMYATENGLFKNQLIDSINEACESCLDGEALIEEDGEDYTIEESFYTEIKR